MSKVDGLRWKVSTLVCRAFLRSRLSLGAEVMFRGYPIVSGAKLGTIRIGDRVQVVSDPTATALGVRSPTILRLLAKDSVIEIGDDCGLSGTVICAARSVRLGVRCLIGADVIIFDTDFHNREPEGRRYAIPVWDKISSPVTIGDDVFIGARATIAKGVTIGNGAIIGTGSVVVSDIPKGAVAAGNPARVVGSVIESPRPTNPPR